MGYSPVLLRGCGGATLWVGRNFGKANRLYIWIWAFAGSDRIDSFDNQAEKLRQVLTVLRQRRDVR